MVDPRNNGVVEEVQAEVRLGRVHYSGPGGDYFSLEIEDKLSGVCFLRLKITDDVAARFFAQRSVPTRVELSGLALVGHERQVKTEWVPALPAPRVYERRAEDAAEAVRPFEVDGWKASRNDYGNSHRISKKGGVEGYNVGFVRFVRPDGTPVL